MSDATAHTDQEELKRTKQLHQMVDWSAFFLFMAIVHAVTFLSSSWDLFAKATYSSVVSALTPYSPLWWAFILSQGLLMILAAWDLGTYFMLYKWKKEPKSFFFWPYWQQERITLVWLLVFPWYCCAWIIGEDRVNVLYQNSLLCLYLVLAEACLYRGNSLLGPKRQDAQTGVDKYLLMALVWIVMSCMIFLIGENLFYMNRFWRIVLTAAVGLLFIYWARKKFLAVNNVMTVPEEKPFAPEIIYSWLEVTERTCRFWVHRNRATLCLLLVVMTAVTLGLQPNLFQKWSNLLYLPFLLWLYINAQLQWAESKVFDGSGSADPKTEELVLSVPLGSIYLFQPDFYLWILGYFRLVDILERFPNWFLLTLLVLWRLNWICFEITDWTVKYFMVKSSPKRWNPHNMLLLLSRLVIMSGMLLAALYLRQYNGWRRLGGVAAAVFLGNALYKIMLLLSSDCYPSHYLDNVLDELEISR